MSSNLPNVVGLIFFVSDHFCSVYHVSTGNRVGRRQPCVPVMEKSPPSRLHGVLLFQRDQRGHDPSGNQAGAHSGRAVYIQVRGRSVSIKINAAEERGAGGHASIFIVIFITLKRCRLRWLECD